MRIVPGMPPSSRDVLATPSCDSSGGCDYNNAITITTHQGGGRDGTSRPAGES